jgi:hypothetical protein
MPYVDLNTIHNPATGTVAPAAWGDQVRDNDEFLIDPPAVSIFESSAQTVNNVTTTALISNEENYDNNAMHSSVTNTSRLTAQTAGRYLVWARILFAASTAGTYRQLSFRVNGTTEYLGMIVPFVNDASVSTLLSSSATVVLAATDYVECMARHNVNPSLNVTMLEFGALFLTR